MTRAPASLVVSTSSLDIKMMSLNAKTKLTFNLFVLNETGDNI